MCILRGSLKHAILEDQFSDLIALIRWLLSTCNSNSKGSGASFWRLLEPQSGMHINKIK